MKVQNTGLKFSDSNELELEFFIGGEGEFVFSCADDFTLSEAEVQSMANSMLDFIRANNRLNSVATLQGKCKK